MYHHQLSEQAIISGFRKGDANIIEDYLRSFDVTSDLRLQFNRMVEDVCDHAPLDREERLLIDMLLLRGFKGKEIAAQMGMTPSAISQKYKKLKEEIIIPYFKKNFDMDLDMVEVMDERAIVCREAAMGEASMPAPTMPGSLIDMYRQRSCQDMDFIKEEVMEQKRTTPEFITFAKEHPELTFLVTRIGCGIAGFTDDEISPLFEEAHEVENIVLPPNW